MRTSVLRSFSRWFSLVALLATGAVVSSDFPAGAVSDPASLVGYDGESLRLDDQAGSLVHTLEISLVEAGSKVQIEETGSGPTLELGTGAGFLGCVLSNAGKIATCTTPTRSLEPKTYQMKVFLSTAEAAQRVSVTGDIQTAMYGGSNGDILQGGPASDLLEGRGGNDILKGGGSDDDIFGQLGDDELDGEEGNDALIGGQGEDRMRGGEGTDAVRYFTKVVKDNLGNVLSELDDWDWRDRGVTANLNGVADDGSSQDDDGDSTDGMDGDWIESGVEQLYGTEFADTLVGDDGANSLNGNGGDDTLTGNKGNDAFRGHGGIDTLYANDGEADTDISCNNSDESRGSNPNTLHYDKGLDGTSDCSVLIASGDDADSGGGNTGGGSNTDGATGGGTAGGGATTGGTTPGGGTSTGGTTAGTKKDTDVVRAVAEVQADKGVVKSVPGAPTLELSPFLVPSSPDEGDTITVFVGKWTGTKPTYAFEWRSCKPNDTEQVKCAVVKRGNGAAGETYRVAKKDNGNVLVVSVIAAQGTKKAQAVTLPTAPIDPRASVNIPADLVPRVAGEYLRQTNLTAARGMFASAVNSGIAEVDYVPAPLKKVPREFRRKIEDNSVYAVTPAAGTSKLGKGSAPVKITVRYYDKALDFAACPNKDIAAWSKAVAGTPLPVAIDKMKSGGCDWRVEWVKTDAKTPYMQVLGAALGEDAEDEVDTTSIILKVSEPRLDEYALLVSAPPREYMFDPTGILTLTPSLNAVALKSKVTSRIWSSLQWLPGGIGRAYATFQLFDINGRLVAEKKTNLDSDAALDYAFTRPGVARLVATVDENSVKGVSKGAADYRQVFVDFDVVEGGNQILLDGRCVTKSEVITEVCSSVDDSVPAGKMLQVLERKGVLPYGKHLFSPPGLREAYLKRGGARFSVQAANRRLSADLVTAKRANPVGAAGLADGERVVTKQSGCFFLDVFCVFGMVKAWVEQAGRPAQPAKKSSVKVDEFAGQALVAPFDENTAWGGLAGDGCVTFAAKAHQCWSVTRKSGDRQLTLDDIVTPSTRFVMGPNELVRFANLKGLSAAEQAEVKTLIAAGGQNLIAAGGQNLIAAGGQNLASIPDKSLSEIASLIANDGLSVPNLPASAVSRLATMVGLGGSDPLIAAGGQNLIAAGGQNLIAAGGQNLIAAGGQNFTADSVLSFARLIGLGASSLINLDGGGLINLDGGNLINLDGGGLINLDGGNLTSVASGAAKDMSQATTAKLSMAVTKSDKIGQVNALMLGSG